MKSPPLRRCSARTAICSSPAGPARSCPSTAARISRPAPCASRNGTTISSPTAISASRSPSRTTATWASTPSPFCTSMRAGSRPRAACAPCRWARRTCRNPRLKARARSPGAAMPWRFIMRTARASSRSTWTSSGARTRSRASSSSPTSRLRAWSSPRPLTSPAISTTTRRSTACAPRAGSSWVTAGSS